VTTESIFSPELPAAWPASSVTGDENNQVFGRTSIIARSVRQRRVKLALALTLALPLVFDVFDQHRPLPISRSTIWTKHEQIIEAIGFPPDQLCFGLTFFSRRERFLQKVFTRWWVRLTVAAPQIRKLKKGHLL
jgi:hypothetical protein